MLPSRSWPFESLPRLRRFVVVRSCRSLLFVYRDGLLRESSNRSAANWFQSAQIQAVVAAHASQSNEVPVRDSGNNPRSYGVGGPSS